MGRPDLSLTETVFESEKFENNLLKVNEYLQIEGCTNIYGIGDCCNTKEFKMAAHAERQAECLVQNFLSTIKGHDKKPYKTAFQGMVVTFGSKAGVGSFNGWNLPSFVISMLKGKTLFSERYWKLMGQEMPQ